MGAALAHGNEVMGVQQRRAATAEQAGYRATVTVASERGVA